MISNRYKYLVEKYGNGFNLMPVETNTFILLLNIFESISNVDDFKHFRNNFPPEWIYIPAIRLNNKNLWVKLFNHIYDYHKNNDRNFKFGDKYKFIDEIISIYDDILLYGGIDYVEGQDLTITFCKKSISDILRNYCSNINIQNFNKEILIHPIERRGTINKVLFYRATIENNFVDKMFDNYEEGKNTKRLAKDFLDYLNKLK